MNATFLERPCSLEKKTVLIKIMLIKTMKENNTGRTKKVATFVNTGILFEIGCHKENTL